MRKRKQSAPRVVFRYLSGRPLDGYPRSNANFLHAGTEAAPGEHPGRWSMLPGWKRAAWRIGLPAAAITTPIGYAIDPTITTGAGATGAASITGYGIYRGYRAARNWQHRRTYVLPFHRTLRRELGVAHTSPDKWLSIPVNYMNENADPVRIQLPGATRIPAEVKVAIRETVAQKLGLRDAIESWNLIGADPVVTFRPAPRPPARVAWKHIAEAFRNAPETAPVLGIGCRNTIVDADLDADSPHILISAGAGGGKSILVRNIITHVLHHGGTAVILDYKRASHRWAEGLPGVKICKDVEEIHNWATALLDECERRNRAADSPFGHVGHRILIVVEEWNALASKLRTYWENARTKDDPKKSPAVAAISDVAFMGRHVKMNIVGIAQMMTAATTGGPETRENFATRCLTRYSMNAWKMLAPEVWPMPKRSKVVGRWQIVKAGEAHETQVAYLDDDQAREWSLSGVDNPAGIIVSQDPVSTPTQDVRPGTVPVGLRAAIDSGDLPGVTLETLRKWRQRDDRFPAAIDRDGAEELYNLEDLITYKRRRDALKTVEGTAA